MSFDFDELKHKAGNMLEKGKEKAHEAAESENGQKIKSKQKSCLKGKGKSPRVRRERNGQKGKEQG